MTEHMTENSSSAAPGLRAVAQIDVLVDAPMMLGELAGVERRMIRILGGKLVGPHFSGSILPGGSDIQTVRADGAIELVARYAVDCGEQGKILIENTGLRRAVPASQGEPKPYFRGVIRFNAPSGPLQWLNDSVFVSRGSREGGTVRLEVFEIL